MEILYIIIILLLFKIYYSQQINKMKNENKFKETFVDNSFENIVDHDEKPSTEIKSELKKVSMFNYKRPTYLPNELETYVYCGKLELNAFNNKEMYLYGKPIELLHKLYDYTVVNVKNKKIVEKFSLPVQKKLHKGSPVFVKDGPKMAGPYVLL